MAMPLQQFPIEIIQELFINMPYAPIEIKKLAIRLFKSGEHTQAAISKIAGYSVSAIKIWIARNRQSLPLAAEKRGRKPRKLNDEDRLLIRKIIGQLPEATIEDVRKALNYKRVSIR